MLGVRNAGIAGWLDAQLAMPPSSSMWAWLVAKGYDAAARRLSTIGLDEMVWRKLLTAPDVLRQRTVFALTELFVVSITGLQGNWRQFSLAAYWELLEQNCFGTYRNLLEKVTLSVAMGQYLNMLGNQKENAATGRVPDENYAREVLQLFSIGLVELAADGTPRLGSDGKPSRATTRRRSPAWRACSPAGPTTASTTTAPSTCASRWLITRRCTRCSRSASSASRSRPTPRAHSR